MQRFHFFERVRDLLPQLRGDQLRQILIGKIDGRLDMGLGPEQLFLEFEQRFGQRARGGTGRGLEPRTRPGLNAIHYGFGLDQIDAAVQEGSLRKFSGVGEAGSDGKNGFENSVQRAASTVAVDFHDVLGRVAVGCAHDVYEHFIEDVFTIPDFAVVHLTRTLRERFSGGRTENLVCPLDCIWSA